MAIKKIAEVNGNISNLVATLNEALEKYGDIEVTVCGTKGINIYHSSNTDTIVLDDSAYLEEE